MKIYVINSNGKANSIYYPLNDRYLQFFVDEEQKEVTIFRDPYFSREAQSQEIEYVVSKIKERGMCFKKTLLLHKHKITFDIDEEDLFRLKLMYNADGFVEIDL